MARSHIHLGQDSTITIAKNISSGNSEPSYHFAKYDYSIHSKGSKAGGRWGPLRNESQVPVISSPRLTDSKDSLPSLTASGSSPSESRRRVSRSSSGATQDLVSYEQPSVLDSHQVMEIPSLDTSSDGLDDLPKKVRGTKGKVNIKPLLRKMSRDDAPSTSIDLSRSSFEQEGLGICTNLERERRQSDSLASIAARKTVSCLHNRSTSGTSQLSAASSSSMSKPGSQYVHPMRQTPRAYTPPLSQSYQTSIIESDDSEEGNIISPDGEFMGQSSSDAFQPFVRATSGQAPRLSLQIHDSSYTRLPGTSQTNVTGRPSFGYSRDNGSTLDTTSPTSRSSLDFVFRSRTRTSTDPISRAATVQAARQAFEEKEAEKARRFEKQQMKAEEKLSRRKEKQHLRKPSKDDQPHQAASAEFLSEKSDAPEISGSGASPFTSKPKLGSWKSRSKSTWMLFVTWLRTRVFKLRRNMRKIH